MERGSPRTDDGGDWPRGVHGVALADPDRAALVFGERRLSYGELDRAANGVAQACAALGAAPGERVAVQLPNRPELFSAWHGVARLGALVVPVSTRLTAPEVAYLLEDSGAVALVHDGSSPDNVPDRAAASVGKPTVSVDGTGAPPPADDAPTEEYLGVPVTMMSYTSGTTGRPKGILRRPPSPARDTPRSPFAEFWGFRPEDVHLMCGPGYHTAPGAYALMTLGEGGCVVVMAKWDARECLRLIEQERVTTSQMVPANFVRILEVDWESFDRSSVRKILHAAAPCPVPLKRRIMEVFPAGTVWEYYGATEGMVSVISPEEWLAKPGSVGRPFPGIEVRILGPDGAELPPGEVGTVYVSVIGGYRFEYHNAPEKTAEVWQGDYFTAGDLGSLDADGYLFLADRRTDLILSGGVNIYPAEVESALIEDDDVVDAAVIGLPDERMGQRVHAVVELRPGTKHDPDALLARLAERLADYKRPRTVEFVVELPREPNGKVLKAQLRAERTPVESTSSVGGSP